jgi:hypothetical protein
MKILETRVDMLTMVIQRKREQTINLKEGGQLFVKCALGYEIAELLGVKRKSERKEGDFGLEGGLIYFANEEDKLIPQFKASFFIKFPNYEEKINQILELLKSKGYTYHFTRIDFLYLLDEPIFKELDRSDFKRTDTLPKKNKNEIYWFSAFSSVYGVVSYDKQKQLKKIKKAQPEYYNHYNSKYGIKPIYHFELRFFEFLKKNSKTQIITKRIPSIWEDKIDFNKVKEEVKKEIFSRVKFKRKILHLVKNEEDYK